MGHGSRSSFSRSASFEQAGEFGTESGWDRYSYVQAEVVVDKSGLVADLVAAKSQLQPEVARSTAAEHLDSYINSYYRAAKNKRSELEVEARLDAAESIPALLSFCSRSISA